MGKLLFSGLQPLRQGSSKHRIAAALLLNASLDLTQGHGADEGGIGDLAFYPDRVMGGVRRQTHWENAREQGLVAGANMSGKKRIKYEQIPYFWTEMFDLHFDFVGDFSIQPNRVETKGTHAKKKFTSRYYQGERLRAILLCNQTQKEIDSAKSELRHALIK